MTFSLFTVMEEGSFFFNGSKDPPDPKDRFLKVTAMRLEAMSEPPVSFPMGSRSAPYLAWITAYLGCSVAVSSTWPVELMRAIAVRDQQ